MLSNNNDQVCLTCPLSKFPKLPNDLSSSPASTSFDLIHIDTCGPYQAPTREKYKYFLNIVVDHSRMTWVYLMQLKSDFLNKFQNFYNYVSTQFHKKIKILRSDNAPEFKDVNCRAMYGECGILHKTSCVNRPQQNTRVERKYKNILEMARELRFHSGLELKF